MEADFVGKQIQYWAASTCRDQNTNQALVLHAKLGGLAEKENRLTVLIVGEIISSQLNFL